MSRIINCIAIDGPCQGRKWESYSHDVNVKLRGRGGVEHQYRMSGAYPGEDKPVEYFYNDPHHVKPVEDAADPIARLPVGSVTDPAPGLNHRITDLDSRSELLGIPGTKQNPL